MNFVESND